MKANEKIKTDYPYYVSLLSGVKRTAFSPFFLEPKANNKTFLLGEVPVAHETIKQNISLLAEQNIKTRAHFGFKLRALHLCPEPFFRFDSDGPTHRNDLDSIPLPERQVTTPHFHKFNSDGVMLAYKTEPLKNVAQVTAIKGDINLGLAHFAQEANVRCPKDGSPEVSEKIIALPLNLDDSDPLAGKTFSQ